MRRLSRALVLPALLCALLLPVTPASAGDTSNVPDATFRIKDVRLNGYTGNIIVAARVSCTGIITSRVMPLSDSWPATS